MNSDEKYGFKKLIVYQKAYKLAMDIFEATKSFPSDERFALISQIRRSSRSVCVNLAEGYGKRKYPKHFINKLTDSDSECSETSVHLDFSRDCKYISEKMHAEFQSVNREIGKILGYMLEHPEKFLPKKNNNSSFQK